MFIGVMSNHVCCFIAQMVHVGLVMVSMRVMIPNLQGMVTLIWVRVEKTLMVMRLISKNSARTAVPTTILPGHMEHILCTGFL